MKNLLLIFTLFSNILIGQEIEFKEYSYTQLFQMIEEEQDTIFKLKNALIIPSISEEERFGFPNSYLDKIEVIHDSIHILKQLRFENVLFGRHKQSNFFSGLSYMVFHEMVEFVNTNINITASTFKEEVRISLNTDFKTIVDKYSNQFLPWLFISFSNLENGINYFNQEEQFDFWFGMISCEIRNTSNKRRNAFFSYREQDDFSLLDNIFYGPGSFLFSALKGRNIDFNRNIVHSDFIRLNIGESGIERINFNKNEFKRKVQLNLGPIKDNHTIDWPQFSGKLICEEAYYNYYSFILNEDGQDTNAISYESDPQEKSTYYLKTARIQNDETYRAEMKFRGRLYNLYKLQFATDFANAAYIEMKDLETERLAYLSSQNPTFKNYFSWKINQFLKVFSAYGTEPARAIIYSMYVIFFFALIYLFFPNSWDSHGKKRIMDRFRFFTKYMKRDAGIHEVYLEEKKEDLLEYEDFKNYMEASGKSIPKFFLVTALPLYKWAISGTKLTSAFLKRVDVMKGTWEDVPDGKRWWKGILLIGAFSIAIIYDIMIKMLNALMLSINTFTTLGFGEIPIKGLPRYLAIIEGFIGWFMLTIFSVSLISQLLN